MPQRALYHRVGNRLIDEAQLLAEKKWITEALSKIRNQRNCLQIERLHLESMKVNLNGDTKVKINTNTTKTEITNIPTTSAVNLMQSAPKSTEFADLMGLSVTDEEIICNEQELDLMISDCLYANNQENVTGNMEEDEEEDEDIIIDMDMLMNRNVM